MLISHSIKVSLLTLLSDLDLPPTKLCLLDVLDAEVAAAL